MSARSEKIDTPTIIVAVLNWGLGHATRMIPVIEGLRSRNVRVIICSSGSAGDLLQLRFTDIAYRQLPDYKVQYSKSGSLLSAVLKNWKTVYQAINSEKKAIRKIVAEEKADAIISDNRYGCRHPDIPSIIITHQLNPVLPRQLKYLQPISERFFSRLLRNFDACWIPDFPDHRLSGRLSKSSRLKIPVRFTNPLSRFEATLKDHISSDQWLAILSGPEPQRSILQEKFIHACETEDKKGIILAGTPGKKERMNGNVKILPHLPDDQFLQLINESAYVLMRPGYSSIMDFYTIGRSALLVPTPGQTEQEYLGHLHSQRNYFISQYQNEIDLSRAEMDLRGVNNPVSLEGKDLLQEEINLLIQKLRS